MAATQMRYEFQPFCYKHQVEMKANQTLRMIEKRPAQEITFTCLNPDCLVHYNSVMGYFTLTQHENGNGIKAEPGPRVRCESDGAPMCLSEFLPERRSLRLWKCPMCRLVRANGEISAASEPSLE